jgi:hypothetical protein
MAFNQQLHTHPHQQLETLTSQQNKSPSTNIPFYSRLINNTNIHISVEETSLLQKGLKYKLHHKRKNWLQTLALEADEAVSYISITEQDTTRHLISRQLSQLHKRHTYDHNRNNVSYTPSKLNSVNIMPLL